MLVSATICHMATQSGLDVAELGRRLLARREMLRLDQEQVADRAGLSRAYISRLERAIVPNPKVGDLLQVAQALETTLPSLLAPDPAPRELFIAEGADVLAAIADEPPELQASILRAVRQAYEIAKTARTTQQN